MPRTATLGTRRNTKHAQQLAQRAADRYFAALAAEIPSDGAPADVSLVDVVCEIQDALLADSSVSYDKDDDRHDAALNAGYLLGVEIGRRLAGGAR